MTLSTIISRLTKVPYSDYDSFSKGYNQAIDKAIAIITEELEREPSEGEIDNAALEVLARTLESIHGDVECFMKQLHDEGVARKSMRKWLEGIYTKCSSVRHIAKAALMAGRKL